MILRRLQLQHFRNYRKLNLELDAGSTLLHGSNGAGKTNVVEAIFTLATTKSFRTRMDRELIDRDFAPDESPVPFARIQGDVEADGAAIRVEILVSGQGENGNGRKQFRLNGLPKRASDVVGQIKAVLFSPADVEIVSGPPSGRRRYVDLMLCQLDPSYLRALQSYTRIVQQRNGVLTRLDGNSRPELLEIWDEKLIDQGSRLIAQRLAMMSRLSALAREMYGQLSNQAERFEVGYMGSIGPVDGLADDLGQADLAAIAERFRAALEIESHRGRDLRVTPVGPHRDDLTLILDGEPLVAFGSRGQQRTAALALRTAEARYIQEQSGRLPILLLDEALGELDDERRQAMVRFIREYPQVVMTGTTPSMYPVEFRQTAALFHVHSGAIERSAPEPV